MTNMERLASLLQRVTGVEAGASPEDTVKRAVKKIRASKTTDPMVKRELAKVKLSEEEMYGGAGPLPTFTDYIRNKFAGEPSTKSWSDIEFAELGHFRDAKKRGDFKKKVTDYSECADLGNCDDIETDVADGIDYKSIDAFMDGLPVADYLDIYDDDDLDFTDFKDDEIAAAEDEAGLSECEDIIRDSTNAAELTEALSRQARLKLRIAMRRNKAKIAQKRKIALKRHSTTDVLKKRAHKLALKMLKQKFAHKAISDMSMADKERVEKILQTKKALVNRLAMKMLPVVRKIEQERFKIKE